MSTGTPQYGDVGTVKEGLKQLLLGPLFVATVALVNQRFTDGITIEPLLESQIKTTDTHGVPSQFPLVELVARTEASPSEEADSSAADIITHEIDVLVWANGDDEESVGKLCERYVLAMRKAFKGASLMPFVANLPIHVSQGEYGVVGRNKDLARPFVKAAAVSIRLKTVELTN